MTLCAEQKFIAFKFINMNNRSVTMHNTHSTSHGRICTILVCAATTKPEYNNRLTMPRREPERVCSCDNK